MDKQPAEVFVVFFQPVVEGFDVLLFEEPQDAFFELAAALAGNDFDQADFLGNSLIDYAVKLRFDGAAFIENVVQV